MVPPVFPLSVEAIVHEGVQCAAKHNEAVTYDSSVFTDVATAILGAAGSTGNIICFVLCEFQTATARMLRYFCTLSCRCFESGVKLTDGFESTFVAKRKLSERGPKHIRKRKWDPVIEASPLKGFG